MQVEKRHTGITVEAYVGSNMEHDGLMYHSKGIAGFKKNQVLFTAFPYHSTHILFGMPTDA